MLSFFSMGTRVGLIFFFSAAVPLNFFRVQNLTAVSPRGKPFGCQRKARVHQDATNRMRSQATCLVTTAVYAFSDSDGVRVLSLIAELCGIMDHKNETVSDDAAITRRLKVTSENIGLTDAVVRKKTIRGLGVRPVLAHQRNAFAHGAPHLRHQLAEPLVETLVGKTATSKLAIKPCVDFPSIGTVPCESVPDKESRPIPATQQVVLSLSPLG
jgi:hypothetical protein